MITAGGENVAPVIAEDNIKAELPCVSNAVLIGDKKKYLSVFLTLKTVVKDDLPTDKLAPDAVLWCQVCSQVQFYVRVLGANLRTLILATVLLLFSYSRILVSSKRGACRFRNYRETT